MYEPVNDRLIVRMPGEEKTESGIIIDNSQAEGAVLRLEVVAAGENNSTFEGKMVLVERRLCRASSTGLRPSRLPALRKVIGR
ncbi:hypothetical protein [Devosia sp. Root105]|uniref:hypothetical protein n=1 Tax=Devosia sp. Root105 TaxID=1736423 RepID=UPI000715A5B9|nr:hypothetical protein [Devosia sp. Root105]KQU93901.1 hypothetical protein ASC68_19655 [Devosia sp. Root105]